MEVTSVEPSSQEFQVVKCVVVGDSGVGKTRMISNRACGTQYTLPQLVGTHVPTVWAIDHYRKDKEILDRSWCRVDGLGVSLRLWDTFGYHDKDRRFAYGRADVVMVCYSVVRPRSLRSVQNHWYPEIQRLCPGVPIILCGCQVDLRYLYMDQEFLELDKGPFYREILSSDIITPAIGRSVAKEAGAFYYETSVLEPFGIEEAFINACRAALLRKRDKHFWYMLNSGLKKICKPECQAPFLQPQPRQPLVEVPLDDWEVDVAGLLASQMCCDVVFRVGGVCIHAHRLVLMAASPAFEELFQMGIVEAVVTAKDLIAKCGPHPSLTHGKDKRNGNDKQTGSGKKGIPRSHSYPFNIAKKAHGNNGHTHTRPTSPTGKRNIETQRLLEETDTETSSSRETIDSLCAAAKHGTTSGTKHGTTADAKANKSLPRRVLNHSVFQLIELQEVCDPFGAKVLQTVVTVADSISPAVMQAIVTFLYTGQCPAVNEIFPDIMHAARRLNLVDMCAIMANALNDEAFKNIEIIDRVQQFRRKGFQSLAIRRGLLPDVVFQLDDGYVAAHKALLVARSDVMAGMFSINFRESMAKLIPFPRVSRDTFLALQEYLYTGELSRWTDVDILELIELANRLCLPRLRALAEEFCVIELSTMEEKGADVTDDALMLLEPAQLHNADDLAAWCLWYLTCHYQDVYKKRAKLIQCLRPDNQILLNNCRWPPLWYEKEFEHYDKCRLDFERSQPIRSYLRSPSEDDSGCLGFCSRRSRNKVKLSPGHVEAVMS